MASPRLGECIRIVHEGEVTGALVCTVGETTTEYPQGEIPYDVTPVDVRILTRDGGDLPYLEGVQLTVWSDEAAQLQQEHGGVWGWQKDGSRPQ